VLTVARVISLLLAGGRRLRPEAGTQLVVASTSPTVPPGDYRVQLEFGVPAGRAVKVKALYAASVSCGASRYLQPILPLVSSMSSVPAFEIGPGATSSIEIPRVAGAVGTETQATRTLPCG
jgi:hypothetical protein